MSGTKMIVGGNKTINYCKEVKMQEQKEINLAIRTLSSIGQQGNGHGALKEVVESLQKKSKKSKK